MRWQEPIAKSHFTQYQNMLNKWINDYVKIIIHQLKSDTSTTTFAYKYQLLVGLQVLHCCISNSRYTQCSLTVSRAVARQGTSCPLDSTQNSTSLWGQLHRPGALLTHSCPETAKCSLLTVVWPHCHLSVQCMYVAKHCSLGRERRCDDQVTVAYHGMPIW